MEHLLTTSDAIAGVINISLKESTGKTSLQLHAGQFYKGDGENISLGIYRGISLNKRGFMNFQMFRNHTLEVVVQRNKIIRVTRT
jgi:hypothetical protein